MNGGVFEAANASPSTGPYTTLYRIDSQPTEGWNEVTGFVNPDTGYRYVRYRSPNGGHCNVAEIEFYHGDNKLTGAIFGTPGSYGNGNMDCSRIFDGNTATYFDAIEADGAYAGLDLHEGSVVGMVIPARAVSAPRAGAEPFVLYDIQGRRIAGLPAGAYCRGALRSAGRGVFISAPKNDRSPRNATRVTLLAQ